jgi:hypothetical protein
VSENWKDGLCREFVKAFSTILEHNQYGENDFNFNQVGYDSIALYKELFEQDK